MANAIEKIKTPKGNLEWVTISGEGKENLSGKMKYQANVVLDPTNVPAHQAIIDKIDAFWEENKPKGFTRKPKSTGYYFHDPILDEDGEPTYNDDGKKIFDKKGKVHLTFSTDTTFPSGDAKVVKIYNAKANVVSLGDKSIGNGSIGYISGAMGIYEAKAKGKTIDAGVTLYLNGIQLTKFVEFTGADDGFAAEEEEDGFTGVDADENSFEPEAKVKL
tara:strand:+ start:440 stop:1093 length:654 start_codon:yes stop_codon:yes gene_type:complete